MSKASKLSRTRGADHVEQPPVPKAQRTRGRPSDYDEAYLPEACEYARQGMTDVQIAEAMGVEVRTLYRWYVAYPQLRQAVKSAKDVQDDQVENALLHQAKIGNTTAQIFWLKNRRPELWRDRRETEIIVPEADAAGEVDQRQLALQALALFNGAVYDPEDDTPAEGLVIEGHAREEIDDGATDDGYRGATPRQGEVRTDEPYDPDFDDRDPDFDLGDV